MQFHCHMWEEEIPMKRFKALHVRVALVAAAGSILLFAGDRSQVRADSTIVIEGTGNFDSVVTRTTETLSPLCVSLISRAGTVAFTGLITNDPQNGVLVARAVRDACASPVQGTSTQTYDLLNATVAGRTGHLVVEAEGVFEGDATTLPGARSRYHLKISGVGGDLKGAEGEGQSVGLATTAASSNTYYVTITVKK
jgi:hypothetical protein